MSNYNAMQEHSFACGQHPPKIERQFYTAVSLDPMHPHTSKWCRSGVISFQDFNPKHFAFAFELWPRVAPVVITLYLIVVVLVMMNLLMAKMGDTYQKISDAAERAWALERARVLYSIENELDEKERADLHEIYVVYDQGQSGVPCFLLQEVDMDFWKVGGGCSPLTSPRSLLSSPRSLSRDLLSRCNSMAIKPSRKNSAVLLR